MPRLLISLALLILASPVRADSCAWTGLNGGSWHVPTSWSCGRVPTAADDVSLGAFNNVPTVGAPIEAQSLTMTGSVSLTVGFGATIGDVIVTSSSVLTVNDAPATFATLVVNGGGALRGSATVTVTEGFAQGTATLGPGTGSLVLAPGSSSRFAAGENETADINGYTLRNEGTLLWEFRGVRVFLGGRIVNAGLLEVQAADIMQTPSGAGGGFLDNLTGGTVQKIGAGTSTLGGQQGVAFDNDGIVEVTEGVLQVGNGVSLPESSGQFLVSAGAVLRVSGNSTFPQPYRLAAGSSVTGAGTVELTGGRLDVLGTFAPATFVMTGGLFAGEGGTIVLPDATVSGGQLASGLVTPGGGGLVRVTGPFRWSGGTIGLNGSATVEVRAEGPAVLDGGEKILIGGGTMTLAGAAAWTSGDVRGGGVLAIAPGGVLDASAEAALVSPNGQGLGVLLNEGTLRKTGSGVTVVGGPQGFRIDNRGLVDVTAGTLRLDGSFGDPIPQTAGTVRLSGGQVEGPRPVVAHAGTVEGTGSLATALTVGSPQGSTARVVPGGEGAVGSLAVSALTLRSGAIADAEVSGTGTGTFDQVTVGGDAALGGTLRVRYAGTFRPVVGDRFPVVTCAGTCSGTFTALDLPDGLTATVEVLPQRADLVVTAIVADEPTPAAPTALALTVAPNPATGSVRLGVSLPEAGDVSLTLHDALGRTVAVLTSGRHLAGQHEITTDLSHLPSGVYRLRLGAEAGVVTRPLTLVR